MIERGIANINVTHQDLVDIEFTDYLQCYRQYPELEDYYTEHNSSVWQLFDWDAEWFHSLCNAVPQDFTHSVTSVVKIDPGQTVPNHVDKHSRVKEVHGDGQTKRYLIFLEDWKSGHYFEIENAVIVNWRQGDWVSFGSCDWHIGGNMGDQPFYTAQVTVIL